MPTMEDIRTEIIHDLSSCQKNYLLRDIFLKAQKITFRTGLFYKFTSKGKKSLSQTKITDIKFTSKRGGGSKHKPLKTYYVYEA